MALYGKGDYVVHPGQGICEVTGILERASQDGTRLEYELYPLTGTRMRICFPVDNEQALRRPVDEREARRLIEMMPQMPDDPFSDSRGWMVEEHFSERIRHGDCRDALSAAKTMYGRMEAARSRGKNPQACYRRLYQMAWSRASEELACALGTSEERVSDLVERSFAKAGE